MRLVHYFRKSGITARLVIYLSVTALVPLLIVSALFLYHAEMAIEEELLSKLSAVTESKTAHIEEIYLNHKKYTNILADDPIVSEALTGLQEAFNREGVQSAYYEEADRKFHQILQYYQQSYGFDDLFLISPDGDIVFSVKKEDDLGTNISTGTLKDSQLADVYAKALSHSHIEMSDFSFYAPSGEPAAFFAAPIKQHDSIIGVVAIQLSISQLYEYSSDYTNLGETGEIVVAQRRADHAELITPLRFDAGAAFQRKVTIGSPEALPIQYAVQGQSGQGYSIDYRGKEILAMWNYLDSMRLGIVVKIDKDEAFSHISHLEQWTMMSFGLTLLLVVSVVVWLANSLSSPIVALTQAAGILSEGDLSVELDIKAQDEIAYLAESFRKMVWMEKAVASHANLIVQGDYSGTIEPRSDKDELGIALRDVTETLREVVKVTSAVSQGDYSKTIAVKGPNDQLGGTINAMTHSLSRITEENSRQDWIKTRQNDMNHRMLGEFDVSTLAHNIISFLAEHLEAQIGAIYVVDEESGELQLAGSYAFIKRKGLMARIKIGEGLVGQAAYEKKMISVADLPDDYTRIGSAIGDALPRNVLVVPFQHDGEVLGVIELGSLREFNDTEMELLSVLTDNIATAFFSVKVRSRMRELLEKTQRQAEDLQTQQEELRASNEELEEQTNSLIESEKLLQMQQEELRASNEELEEKTESLQRQSKDIQQKNEDLEASRHSLQKQAEELSLASKYKSEFLSNMSHELRTPLNSLLLLSHSLGDNKEENLNEAQIKSARIIHSCGKDLLDIINDILDLSKIEAGRMTLESERVSLVETADGIKSGFHHMAVDKGISFAVDVSPDTPKFIITDRQRMIQIVKNLVSNAIKFTHQGGVTVRLSRVPEDLQSPINGLTQADSFAIAVIDTGIGIPVAKQQAVFEAFQQAEGSTTREYGGTGLGLSISRKLARLLGGDIQLVSTEGQGSTFTLFLPIESKGSDKTPSEDLLHSPDPVLPSAPAAQSGNEEPKSGAGEDAPFADDRNDLQEVDRVVLIIEDDVRFADILLDLCHQKGFKCLVALSGEEGLKIVRKYQPAGIILDLKLPGMNGWTVLDRLKTNPSIRHIPVHIISGEEATVEAFRKGVIGFLTKPATGEQIDAALGKLEKTIDRQIQELLVVEDDQILRHEVVALIGNGDVKITQAASGQEALDALKAQPYDCMVLDLGLPDMSGFELLELLEKEPSVKVPPVIVYTGRELTKEEDMALRHYASSIIIKGVKSAERLLDETALFLHRVVGNLPENKKQMIISLHDQDIMFEGKKVLLVDDDMRNVFALSKILKEKGMQVRMAGDGRTALDIMAKEADVDLVLMDIMMPVMDGYETTRRIRKMEGFSSLPIIALTAKAMKEDREKCIAAGASDYLVKPVEVDRLFSMMRVWLYQ